MTDRYTELALSAADGNRAALEELIHGVRDDVHHLAVRFLVNRDDAADAAQDILLLLITKLSAFEGRSRFRTWMYRVACNHLLNAKKLRARDPGLSFDMFEQDLLSGLVDEAAARADDHVMLNELRVGCTTAMLLCLDAKHRLAYVLGCVLEIDQVEAAEILQISKESFRQQVSRARKKVEAFTAQTCGLVSDTAPCTCPKRLPAARALGRVGPGGCGIGLPKNAPPYEDVVTRAKSLEHSLRSLCTQQATGLFEDPRDFGRYLDRLLTVSP